MMTDEQLFKKFRPYCALLSTEPSLEVLERLKQLVVETEANQLEAIQEYLIFPAQLHLKTGAGKTPGNFTVAVLEYVETLYSRAALHSAFIFEDILSSCLGLLSSLKLTEDLQYQMCCSLGCLLRAGRGREVVSEIYRADQDKVRLPLSHLIFSLLSWTSNPATPARVKVSALSLVSELCQADRRLVAELLVSMLPGVTSKLARLTQESSLSPPVLSAALTAWASFVTTILHNSNFTTDLNTDLCQPPLKPPDWLAEAQQQLLQHIQIFQPLALHSDHRVRGSLLHLVREVLTSCDQTLQSAVENILRLLIILTQDEYPDTSQQARILLHDLLRKSDDERMFQLNTFIKKNLFSLIKDLETSLGLYESQKLMTNLSLLGGFLTFLCHEENVSDIFLSQVQLRRLVQGLVLVSKFEDKSGAIVSTSTSVDPDSLDLLFDPKYVESCRPDKQLFYLRTAKLVRQTEKICRTVGASSGLSPLSVIMLEAVSELPDLRRETIWVLNNMISGCERPGSQEDREALEEVLRLYLSLCPHHEEAVEGVGIVCRVLGPHFDVGFVLGDLLTSGHSALVLHHSLLDVAAGQGGTISDLLQRNVDHLSKDLNLRMRRLSSLTGSGSGVLMLIRVVLRVPGASHDLRDLQDTVQSLLLHLAVVEDCSVATLLNIVQVFVAAMTDKMAADQASTEAEREEECEEEGLILRMISELEVERKAREEEAEQLLRCPEEGFHETTEAGEETTAEEEVEEVEEAASREQEWLRTVLSHTAHYVSMAGRPDWQISALVTVTSCLELLGASPGQAPGGRQTILLPLVHTVWQPLKLCFKSSNLYLVDKVSFPDSDQGLQFLSFPGVPMCDDDSQARPGLRPLQDRQGGFPAAPSVPEKPADPRGGP